MNGIEAQREEAMEFLSRAFADGQLEIDEYEHRLERAVDARTSTEIAGVIADLPSAPMRRLSPGDDDRSVGNGSPRAAQRRRTPPPSNTAESDQTVVSVLGSRVLRGDWLRTRHTTSLTLLGSTRIDLRECNVPEQATIHVVSIMGECHIHVPEDIEVINTLTPLLAEVSDNAKRSRTPRATIRITGVALMSEVKIRRV